MAKIVVGKNGKDKKDVIKDKIKDKDLAGYVLNPLPEDVLFEIDDVVDAIEEEIRLLRISRATNIPYHDIANRYGVFAEDVKLIDDEVLKLIALANPTPIEP